MLAPLAPAIAYWFMLPACVVIAGVSIFAGISGATLLLPLFFLLFPHFGVPALTTVQAVGASLVLQIAAFGLAVYRYTTRGLVLWPTVARIAAISVPAAVVGALVEPYVPVAAFRLIFSAGLVVVAVSLWAQRRGAALSTVPPCMGAGELALAGGLGGLITGIVSAGAGEATIPVLSRRGLALPLVAATATAVVAVTVGAATVTTVGRLMAGPGLGHAAWPVMAWGTPGAVLGEELAVRNQGRIPERLVRLVLGAVFLVVTGAFVNLALQH